MDWHERAVREKFPNWMKTETSSFFNAADSITEK